MSTAFDKSIDFDAAVLLGLVPGWTQVRVVGYNADIDAGTEDLWQGGGVKTFPTTAGAVTIVSTSASDAAAGTGAIAVVVEGLDANYTPISETLLLNGVSNVVGAQLFFRVNRAYVTIVGSGGVNAGDISGTVGGNTQFFIAAGFGATQDGHYTIPAGYTMLVTRYQIACGRLGAVDLQVVGAARTPNGASTDGYGSWLVLNSFSMSEGSSHVLEPRFRLFQGKTDVRIQGVSSGANASATVIWMGYLIENNALIASR